MSVGDGEHVDKPRAITSSIRDTIDHLRAREGRFSAFRGFQIAIFYGIGGNLTTSLLFFLFKAYDLSGFQLNGLSMALTCTISVVLSPVHLWWNHVVISISSQQNRSHWPMLFQALSKFKEIALPTLIYTMVQYIVHSLPGPAIDYSSLPRYLENRSGSNLQLHPILLSLGILSVHLVSFFCIKIPTDVMLYRVYASLLPGHCTTIVPCDRTFGGKVVPEHHDGKGRLGMLDALRTFDRASWIRIFKLYAKVYTIRSALGTVFTILLSVEMFTIESIRR